MCVVGLGDMTMSGKYRHVDVSSRVTEDQGRH